MLPLFEHLQEAVALKRFLDEFEKNPRRTSLALAAVCLIAVGGAHAAYQAASSNASPPPVLSTLPSEPPRLTSDGALESLPYPAAAEAALQATLAANAVHAQQLGQALASRPVDAPMTEDEARQLSASGQVRY